MTKPQLTPHPQRRLPLLNEPKAKELRGHYIKAIDPLGRYIVTGDSHSTALNALYRIDSNGRRLKLTDTFGRSGDLIVEPGGRYLYALSYKWNQAEQRATHSYVTAYRVDAGGKVTISIASITLADAVIKKLVFVAPKAKSGAAVRK